MSRVIKFRAWSRTDKKMLDRVLAGPGDPCSIVWIEEQKTWVQFDEACGEVLQFTGILDRYGKEIYEGDILEIQGATAKVVFWEHPPEFGLDFSHNEDEWCEDWNLCDDRDRMTIIGNIYDNPEMIK